MMELKEKCIHPIWEKPYIRSIHGGANHAVETKVTRPMTRDRRCMI
jgi:hypothetical protein